MKTTTFFVLSLLLVASLPCFALNYTITFTGSGASTTIGYVIVQNLTKGTSVTVPAGNMLNLSDAPNAVDQVSANDEMIHVYPASVAGKSIVSFFAKQVGVTQINAFSLDGRKVAGISTDLQAGSNTFELSLSKGVFVIQVIGNEYAYTAKMLNTSGTQGKTEIEHIGTEKPVSSGLQKTKSSTLGTTTMAYTAGDQLLYKAVSGNYSTIVTDVPTSNKTTNFNFMACTDADGNNYTVVTIGSQTWMAENLKTTQYNDGTAIPLVTDNTAWANLTTDAYCWYNNDAATYKNLYGALYNWYAVNTGKLAPTGWRVPTDAEWTTLENYLIANGYNYDGSTSGDNYAKSLAATTDWATYSGTGTIGNDLTKNNRSGFSALPGGGRVDYSGTFYLDVGYGYWWSSTELSTSSAGYRGMSYYYSNVDRNYLGKQGGFSVRCVRDILTLTTTAASSIATATATTGGNITNDGGTPITARGICWSTSANPTIADSITTNGTGTGTFISSLTGLTANTTYYIRAYATNSVGTAYGIQLSFKTATVATATLSDIDGNVYQTITIGTQTWMTSNLRVTHYRDGSLIANVTDNTSWSGLYTGAWCDYSNLTANGTKYGHLYNWYAVSNSRNIAPLGWHVSTDAEWTTLTDYVTANLGTSLNVAKALAATTDWAIDTGTGTIGNDLSKNNRTGFSALPGGDRGYNDGAFYDVGSYGYWWSSTEYNTYYAWTRGMNYGSSFVFGNNGNKHGGFSVRCVRDN